MTDRITPTRTILGVLVGATLSSILTFHLFPLILGKELYRVFINPQYYGYPPSLCTLFSVIESALLLCVTFIIMFLICAYPFQNKIKNKAIRILIMIGTIPFIITIGLLTIFHLFEFDIGWTASMGIILGGVLIGTAITWNTLMKLERMLVSK